MKTAKSTEINTQSGHHLRSLAGMQRVGDTPCDRETEINCSETFDATEKMTYLTIYYSASGCASSDVSVRSESQSLSLLLLSTENSLLLLSAANVNSPAVYVFSMNDKACPHSINTSDKCSYLFPYFPSLESRLAGEQTVPAENNVGRYRNVNSLVRDVKSCLANRAA
jgi:hypothetical protein